MKPTVGVFVPCYNYARFLDDCVRSILDQSGVDVSVLIIDDASTDRTPEVGARLALDDRVEYRRHATNKGHLATYNEGIEWASRQYTVLLSADDLLTDGSLERATTALEANPEAGFAYGRVLVWQHGQPKPTPRRNGGPVPFEVRTGGDWIEGVCKDGWNHIFSPEVVVRTSVQKEVGGYRPDLPHAGDMEMWLRIAARSSVVILQSDQAYYRVHGKNMHEPAKVTSVDLEQRRLVFDVVLRSPPPPSAAHPRARRVHLPGCRSCACLSGRRRQRVLHPVTGPDRPIACVTRPRAHATAGFTSRRESANQSRRRWPSTASR